MFRLAAECFRWLLSKCGMRFVILTDMDGEKTVRRIWFRGGQAMASRFGVKEVMILDNGAIGHGDFVKRWEPYQPFQPKRWPTWERA